MRARATDPETSQLAGLLVSPSDTQRRILDLLDLGPMADVDLVKAYRIRYPEHPVKDATIRSRRHELQDAAAVIPQGTVRIDGRLHTLWGPPKDTLW